MSKVEQNEKFILALASGACDVVDTMLAEGYIPKPNSIAMVCQLGNVDLLTKLLKYPMDVQQGLFTAVKNSQTHLLDHLFLAGADVNLPDSDQNTALHLVQDVETCRWLLDMGARQTINRYGKTPLNRVVAREKEDVVKIMLSQEQGVQAISITDDDGKTPLSIACRWNCAAIVNLLLSHEQGVQSISITNNEGDTPLSIACISGNANVVGLLLSYEQGVQSISITNNYGNTPLFEACSSGNENVVNLLLSHERGVQSISITNNEGDTPLSIACILGKAHVAKLLLSYEQGVQSISIMDKYGNNPLHHACCNRHVHMIEILLSRVRPHFSLDQVSKLLTQASSSGKTPMSIAKKHPKIMAVFDKHVFGCTIQ